MLYADALRRRGLSSTLEPAFPAPPPPPRPPPPGVRRCMERAARRSTGRLPWCCARPGATTARLAEFRAWTEAMAASTRLFNPIGLVRWNLRKDYVGKLATAGIRTPGTRIVAREAADIERVFDETGWRRAVVKPATGGGGHSVELLSRDTVADAVPRLAAGDVLVQEFLPEIAEGELSMVYFDGVFSHAIRKRPPEGEFRSNSRYGPTRAAGDAAGRGGGAGRGRLACAARDAALCPRRWRGARRCADRDRGRGAGARAVHGVRSAVGRTLRRRQH